MDSNLIIIEVADTDEKIDRAKAERAMIIKEGLITEERASMVFVGEKKPSDEDGEKLYICSDAFLVLMS